MHIVQVNTADKAGGAESVAWQLFHAYRRRGYESSLVVGLKRSQDPDVVVIDLEKSRIKLFPAIRALYDLATLNRHAKHWSRSRRLYFLMQYYGIERLGWWHKLMCRLIVRKRSRGPRRGCHRCGCRIVVSKSWIDPTSA